MNIISLIPFSFVQSMVRHALTAGGTWLIAKGIGDAAYVELFVGFGTATAGVAWSWLTHKAASDAPKP